MNKIKISVLFLSLGIFMNFICTHPPVSTCADAQIFIRNMEKVPIMNVFLLNQGARCVRLKKADTSEEFIKSKVSNFDKEVAIIKGRRFISTEDKIVQLTNFNGEIDYVVGYDDQVCKDGMYTMEITETQSLAAADGFCYRLLFISTDGHRTRSEILMVSDSVGNAIWAIYSSFIE